MFKIIHGRTSGHVCSGSSTPPTPQPTSSNYTTDPLYTAPSHHSVPNAQTQAMPLTVPPFRIMTQVKLSVIVQ